MEREALKLALEALENPWNAGPDGIADAITAIKAALAQPAQEQWNAALDEAAARIGEITAFPKTTQDSFAIYIKGLKK